MIKKILYVLLAALVIIQFIRPSKNQSTGSNAYEINTKFIMPADVKAVMEIACYDCHSNNTRYPWYANVQPVAWWLQGHIIDGKKELNFSEFTIYAPKKQYRKFKEIKEMISTGEMPLESYTWIHKNAVLSKEQATAITEWCDENMAKLPAPEPNK